MDKIKISSVLNKTANKERIIKKEICSRSYLLNQL